MTGSDAAKKTAEVAKRTWRSIAAHPITVSFGLVVLLAFLLVTGIGYSVNSIRDLSRSNHAAITKLAKVQAEQTRLRADRAKLRDEEAARAASSDLRLCNEIEGLKSVIRGVVAPTRAQLLQSPYFQQHPELIPAAIKSGEATAAKFAARDCTQLPSQKPPPVPPKKK